MSSWTSLADDPPYEGQKNSPPLPFLRFFGTRSSLAKLAIFFMRACAAALFLSLRAAFLLARSFILFMMVYIPVEKE